MANRDFTNVQVGDKVEVRHGGWASVSEVREVSHVTPTRFTVGTHTFRKTDARRVGGSTWDAVWVEHATPERIAEITQENRIRRLRRELREVDWQRQTDATVEAVYTLLISTEAKPES